MKDSKKEIIEHQLIKQIIKQLNLNENQIESGIELFQKIIEEQENSSNLNFKTKIKVYDENNIIGVVVPNGSLKDALIREKYHLLNKITFLNPSIKFHKNISADIHSIKEDFFWSLKESPENDRSEVARWFKNFYKAKIENVNDKNFKGFYLHGEFGVGKTTFLSAFANYLIDHKKTVVYIKLSDLSNQLKKMFDDSEKIHNLIDTIKNSDYLLIDDIGSEKASEWLLLDVLFQILDFRSTYKKVTCFTSNYEIKSLEQIYIKNKNIDSLGIKRLIDRISSLTESITMKGNNIKNIL